MKTVVLFGGTFDPPHIGHLMMAQLAYEQTECEAVWVMPAPSPPHKEGLLVSPYRVRRDMTAQLIAGSQGLVLCEVEAEREALSFTVDTVRILQEQHPDTEFRFLMGSDSLHDLPTWHGSNELTKRIDFMVAARAEAPFEETYARVKEVLPDLRAHLLRMPMLDVSSTFIRERLEQGKPLCGLVPDMVLETWNRYAGS
ncbi:nicotinate (nicotinamide) nucleotide adenylyltransferase [Alicyclobacillus ferrooxydans]|uniref:Probable nicotinate-nucleotide adenylyltransferase n=1 Tax=Alicyclobacillus ferrooxydans TaxID=471514 RepID=A0A0P9C6Z3_9BACL|nr:nicotinate (nicotinamide) nucleotide adenylyltransferase [Alicyclobacillus ferrooxydans]KPV38976.1 hypothetical protein AN477_23450 [Alicyclobacillus ferrooxydans]